MKNFLKKLHIGSNQTEDSEGSTSSSRSKRLSDDSSPEKLSNSRTYHGSDNKPFSAISGWLNSVTNRNNSPSPPSSSNVSRGNRMEHSGSASISGTDGAASDAVQRDSESSNSRDPGIEEEYQIQLALELSAKEDPEAVQIEAVKQISLGSSAPKNAPAEVVAYRYWNYNALSYDDKILDGFYDLYGVLMESNSSKMPSLIDLQRAEVLDHISWEAILVSKAADSKLLKLEQRALEIAVEERSKLIDFSDSCLVQKLAALVSDHMGGPVVDPESMLLAWRSLSYNLKATLGSMVLPLGSLTIGLARHRALLFKVLADSVGIPCRLVKGKQYTGSDDVAMNYVKIDGREYIVDLMAAPGTIIPSDTCGVHRDCEESILSISPSSKDVDSHPGSFSSGIASSLEDHSDYGTADKRSRFAESTIAENESPSYGNSEQQIKAEKEYYNTVHDFTNALDMKEQGQETSSGAGHTRSSFTHARSPSWTEGVSSPAVRRMKVKDASQYMIDAAKENPQLAQKLHNVLLESGVIAPPNLFAEIYPDQLDAEGKSRLEEIESKETDGFQKIRDQSDVNRARFLPPLTYHGPHSKGNARGPLEPQPDVREVGGQQAPLKHKEKMPVAAAAAAAAVVASSMVAAAAKTTNSHTDLPVAAAATATATAAAVVATTVAVGKQYEALGDSERVDGDADTAINEQQGSGHSEGERISDRSSGSAKSDVTFDDVADCEIPWEDITLGERIGLGSYGEVYRGEWHGTEVAVKKFLDQDITGESLEEFRSEVRIMKRLRHPNVVLFMGAVTRSPHLSIVTEFLHRGSLYRLLHRPNNQLDERRRLRMALDAARGMNYLHNCTPVIVHRDLKSPNLLVDRNWVVKVCDFGLSRMKNSTFLSSRSTAGTAEWMAPEVLRNEPSNEKCDVYSFGVILWELCTLQQPWGGMNPMQVVGAVGFQHRRLDIPEDMDPAIADIIRKCWQTDPKLRPSFAEIMAALKPLQKPITSSHAPKPPAGRGSGRVSHRET
ncbi:probable serine/threonine-protein kinase SIS8 isoform X1 [Lycium barbarum]|uniref:probable serine/threonine-protein kinase SIS8 isoform X1 n=4 Tax=Lycium barbarum TaxID=112863 RepID=UPI00293EF624|nr:probable serine/threonine-protein kinase SIS8 isoform X1 [Lycium barbarum]